MAKAPSDPTAECFRAARFPRRRPATRERFRFDLRKDKTRSCWAASSGLTRARLRARDVQAGIVILAKDGARFDEHGVTFSVVLEPHGTLATFRSVATSAK